MHGRGWAPVLQVLFLALLLWLSAALEPKRSKLSFQVETPPEEVQLNSDEDEAVPAGTMLPSRSHRRRRRSLDGAILEAVDNAERDEVLQHWHLRNQSSSSGGAWHRHLALVQLMHAHSAAALEAIRTGSFNPAVLILGVIVLLLMIMIVVTVSKGSDHGPRQELPSQRKPAVRCPAPSAAEIMRAAEASARNLPRSSRAPVLLGNGRNEGKDFAELWQGGAASAPIPPQSTRGRLFSVQSIPAASAVSLPPPSLPTPRDCRGDADLFDWSGRSSMDRTFCPCLLVPDGMEFVFAVREVLTRERQQLSFSVVDMEGQPLSHVIVKESGAGPQCGIFLRMLDGEALASVRTDMCFKQPVGLPEICQSSGEAFCSMAKDGGAYHLQSRAGQRSMSLRGNFREKAVKVTDSFGNLICETERCIIDFEGGSHYQVRVAPGNDAGLVLCSLLALDKIEGSSRAM